MARKKKSTGSGRNFSKLHQHKKSGKKFLPPFLQIPNMTPASWQTERLPEMLWAVLLVSTLDREVALEVFRRIANYVFELKKPDQFEDITLSGLSKLPNPALEATIRTLISSDHRVPEALAPMLLFKDLPARETWAKHLPDLESKVGWQRLARGVASTLDHQSQQSTDCRWIRILIPLLVGRIKLGSLELFREMAEYPNFGDMRQVRPSIRACEIAQPFEKTGWPDLFWSACMKSTGCAPILLRRSSALPTKRFSSESFATSWTDLWELFHETRTTTSADAKHETVFGFGFYSLLLAGEITRGGIQASITGRLALRAIVECLITLAYLLKLDEPNLWKSYRAFGTGQAKLAFLKLHESGSVPAHVSLEDLEMLANEDAWIEFVPIDVGHWEKSNLREMSLKAGMKDVYDRFYSWTSTFSHGHWSATRIAAYDTCANPLHRLHRIPKDRIPTFQNVVSDVTQLVDTILSLVSKTYPGREFAFGCESGREQES